MVTLNCIIECKDWILLSLSIFMTSLWFIAIYLLKPRLIVEKVELDYGLNIKVTNSGCFDAINIKIEACSIVDNTLTYHFLLDKSDFIAIPRKKSSDENENNIRVFKSKELSNSAKEYSTFDKVIEQLLDGKDILRIRIHACHSFTGFGRLHEFKFQYQNGKFVHLKV